MTTNPKGYMKSYYHKRRKCVIQLLGNKCYHPDCLENTKLEFAHKQDTGVKGYGLSGWARIYDVLKNATSYMLLCKYHHEQFDHHEHKYNGLCYICTIYSLYKIPFVFCKVDKNG